MRIPEITSMGHRRGRPPIPGRVLGGDRAVVHKRLVLDDQGRAEVRQQLLQVRVDARYVCSLYQILLDFVRYQVARGFARVHIQAGDAPGVVVVEHQPGTLLIIVVEG